MFTLLLETGNELRAIMVANRSQEMDQLWVNDLLRITSASTKAIGGILRATQAECEAYAHDRWEREAVQAGSRVRELLRLDGVS